MNEAGTAETLEIEVTFPEIETDDDIVEALDQTLTFEVNMGFKSEMPVGAVVSDDMEVASSSLLDLKENVMFGGDLAVGTQVMDNSGNIAFFEQGGFELGTQAMRLVNNGFQSDVAIESKPFKLVTQATLKSRFGISIVLSKTGMVVCRS
ncbi:hypothetical protein P4S63_19910 [Pseudoalteromonas sp. B193]